MRPDCSQDEKNLVIVNFFLTIFTADEDVTHTSHMVLSSDVVFM